MVFGLSFNSNFTQNILHLNVLFILTVKYITIFTDLPPSVPDYIHAP